MYIKNYTKFKKITICKNFYILFIQIMVCLLSLFVLFMLKILNKNSYCDIKNWLNFQLNDSLIANNEYKNKFSVLNSKGVPLSLTVEFSKPVNNGVVTSCFGKRKDPITKNIEIKHKGIDIGANIGEDIYSVLPGNIELAKYYGGYGNSVVINHGNNVQTLYAHCQKLNVIPNEFVIKGQKIATIGSTGRSTGSHLHFEVIINEINYSPEIFLSKIYPKKNEI